MAAEVWQPDTGESRLSRVAGPKGGRPAGPVTGGSRRRMARLWSRGAARRPCGQTRDSRRRLPPVTGPAGRPPSAQPPERAGILRYPAATLLLPHFSARPMSSGVPPAARLRQGSELDEESSCRKKHAVWVKSGSESGSESGSSGCRAGVEPPATHPTWWPCTGPAARGPPARPPNLGSRRPRGEGGLPPPLNLPGMQGGSAPCTPPAGSAACSAGGLASGGLLRRPQAPGGLGAARSLAVALGR